MHDLKIIRELILIAILAAVFGVMLAAAFAPEKYGKWLQRIDNGRFVHLDCDCTEPLE